MTFKNITINNINIIINMNIQNINKIINMNFKNINIIISININNINSDVREDLKVLACGTLEGTGLAGYNHRLPQW